MKQSNQQIFLHALLLGVSFLLVSLLSTGGLSAQTTTHQITLQTDKKVGEKVKLSLAAVDLTKVTIDGIKEPLPSPEDAVYPKLYTLTKQTITIRGELTVLYIREAGLTHIDVTKMPSLTALNCSDNKIDVLDISSNKELRSLDCSNNRIHTLQGLRSTPHLSTFACYNNKLTVLDLPNASSIIALSCDDNQISSLDLSKLPKVYDLNCARNKLSTLDLIHAPKLQHLDCSENAIKSLDFSKQDHINEIICHQNQIQGEAMTRMMKSLPTVRNRGNKKGRLTLVANLPNVTDNVATKLDVLLATGTKNWQVTDTQGQPYTGVNAYAITLEVGQGGTAQITGAKDLTKVPAGTTLTVVATPKEGYLLDRIFAESTDITASKQFVVKEVTTVRVTFKKKPLPPKKFFEITLSVGEGGTAQLTGADNLARVPEGTTLTVVATPKEGYILDRIMAWDQDITESKQFVVKEPLTVRVTFKKKPEPKKNYAVTLSVGEGGTAQITGAEDLTKVVEGTKLTVVATPQKGYLLDKIMAGDLDITESKQFVVKAETTVKVSFKKDTGVETVVEFRMQIYPNPFAERIVITVPAERLGETAYLTSMEGELIQQVVLTDVETVIYTNGLHSGAYILRVGDETQLLIRE